MGLQCQLCYRVPLLKKFDSMGKLYEISAQSTLPDFPDYKYRSAFTAHGRERATRDSYTSSRYYPQRQTLPSIQEASGSNKHRPLQRPAKSHIEFPTIPKTPAVMTRSVSNKYLHEKLPAPPKATTASVKVSPGPTAPRQSSEDMLYRLLELKDRRNTSAYRMPNTTQVPIDDAWRAAIQSHTRLESDSRRPSLKKENSHPSFKMSLKRQSSSIKGTSEDARAAGASPTTSYMPVWQRLSSHVKKERIAAKFAEEK